MNKESKTICPAVWDHLCVNTMGRNRLCCNALTNNNDKIFLDPNDTEKQIKQKDLLEWSRSSDIDGRTLIAGLGFLKHWTHNREPTKKALLKGEQPKVCQQCWHKEKIGMKSLRQFMIDRYKRRNIWEDFLKRANNKKIINKTPTELDLKLGNFCNLSCRMCSGFSSSKFLSETRKILKETGYDTSKNRYEKDLHKHIVPWWDYPEFLQLLYYFIDNGLRSIKFTGGEPLMVPNVKKVMEYCIETNKVKDLELTIITNMTLIDKEWMNLFSEFKQVSIIGSIDGIGKTYEYIRYPTNWNDVYNKLKLISADSNVYNNDKMDKDGKFIPSKESYIVGTFTFTLSIYNILEVKNIINLRREIGFGLNCIPVFNPAYLDVKYAPELLKDEALEMAESIEPVNENEAIFIKDFKAKVEESESNIGNIKEMQNKMLEITRVKDPFRKQNFDDQDIAKYYS